MRIIAGDWHFWDEGLDWEQSFKKLKELGFDGVELGIRQPLKELTQEAIKQLNDIQESVGITIEVVDYFLPPALYTKGGITSDDEQTQQNIKQGMKVVADTAAKLGAPTMGLWLGADRVERGSEYQKMWDIVVENMDELAEYCKTKGVRLCLEYKPGEIINNSDALLRLFENVSSDNLGALLDVGHAIMQGEDEVVVLQKMKDHITHIHLDDNYGDYDRDMPPGSVHNFQPFLQKLDAIGYKGVIGLDIYYYIAEGYMPAYQALEISKAYVDNVCHHD